MLQAPSPNGRVWEGEQPAAEEIKFQGLLSEIKYIYIHESHPSALMDLCGGIVRLLPVTYKKLLVSDVCPPSGVSELYAHLKKGKNEDLESSGGQLLLTP